jgi:large subunit ribosomal protein L10
MKTKAQKVQDIKKAEELLEGSKSLIFVDFSKTPTSELWSLRNALRSIESTYRVIKKRLLGIVFGKKNVSVDINQFESQLGTIFSPKDITDSAGVVYNFIKSKGKDSIGFRMVGGYDISDAKFYSASEINYIAQLPPKEVLLGQLVGMVQAPLCSLAYVLDQISKKVSN